MAQVKISALPQVENVKDNDIFAGVNTDSSTTMKATAKQIKDYVKKDLVFSDIGSVPDFALAKDVYDKTEIDTKVQAINTTTKGLDTRLTTAEKNIETNKTDIKDLSNRTKRIETDIFDSGEASGTGINLQDSTLAEFQEVKIDGVGNQVTTNGYQLVDKTKTVSNDSAIVSLEQITNGIKLTSLIETSGYRYVAIPLNNVDDLLGKKFYFSCKSNKSDKTLIGAKFFWFTTYDKDIITSFPNLKGTFSVPEEKPEGVTKIRLCLYLSNGATNVPKGTFVEYTDILLKEGTEEAEYEPYTGGEPSPSPDYKQPIEVITEDFDLVSCGNQLLDIKNGKKSRGVSFEFSNDILTVNCEPGTSYQSLYFDFTDIVKNNPGKKIYYKDESNSITDSNSKSLIHFSTKKSDDSITYNTIYNFVTKTPAPYIIPEDTSDIKTVSLNILVNNTSETNISNTIKMVKPIISFNDNDTYEPYTETRQTITMPEREFAGKIDDTYKDQFRINYNEEDGKYHLYLDKVIGKKVLNGSEAWTSLTDKTKIRYTTRRINNINPVNFGICDYFIKTETHDYFRPKTFRIAPSGAISFCYDNVMSLEQFKRWLSTHNVEVYYVLAEPYTLDLGVVNMPLSYYPITNVYNTCVGIPNMYVKYYRDFKKTVTTMQVDIQELKSTIQELTSNQTELLSQINALQKNQVVEEESEVVTQ